MMQVHIHVQTHGERVEQPYANNRQQSGQSQQTQHKTATSGGEAAQSWAEALVLLFGAN